MAPLHVIRKSGVTCSMLTISRLASAPEKHCPFAGVLSAPPVFLLATPSSNGIPFPKAASGVCVAVRRQDRVDREAC
ncbi:hypothetical protein CSUI_007292, partial [Cystoisospora suis]